MLTKEYFRGIFECQFFKNLSSRCRGKKMDLEKEEEGRPPLQRDTPAPCSCDQLLSQTAKFRGVTCQEVFRQAFVLVGLNEAYARAIFAIFLSSGKKKFLLPRLVKMYCETTNLNTEGLQPEVQYNFCLGCTVNPVVQQSIHEIYGMAFPDIDEAFLQSITKSNEPLGLNDQAVLEQMIANLPDEEEWFDLMRQDDFE